MSMQGSVEAKSIYKRLFFLCRHHPVDWNDEQVSLEKKEPRRGRRLTLAATVHHPSGPPLLVYSVHLEVRLSMPSMHDSPSQSHLYQAVTRIPGYLAAITVKLSKTGCMVQTNRACLFHCRSSVACCPASPNLLTSCLMLNSRLTR